LSLKIDNEFGEESVKNYYKHFTKEEQIKRYTDNIIFWIERIPKKYSYNNEEDHIRWEIATNKLKTLIL
jgi:hypothetical protein